MRGRGATAALLALGQVLLPMAARAQEAPGARANAREDFHFAQEAYNLGQFEAALERFTDAYRHAARPELLFDIGQCHRQLGHPAKAAFFYRRYLELSPAGPSAELARSLLAEMDAAALHEAAAGSVGERLATARPAPPVHREELWRNGWFWAGVGVVMAGATTTALVLANHSGGPTPGSLGTVQER